MRKEEEELRRKGRSLEGWEAIEDRYLRQEAWCVLKHCRTEYSRNHFWFLKGLKSRI